MPAIQTKYFGNIEYSDDARLHFAGGLPGFEGERWFVLVERPADRPLGFLQSLSTPELCFVTLPARSIAPDYDLRLSADDLATLGYPPAARPAIGADVLALAILSFQPDLPPTANLLAPLVVRLDTREAVQAIQTESGYSHRHALSAQPEEAAC
jgi:flagellar assembly factor FliW